MTTWQPQYIPEGDPMDDEGWYVRTPFDAEDKLRWSFHVLGDGSVAKWIAGDLTRNWDDAKRADIDSNRAACGEPVLWILWDEVSGKRTVWEFDGGHRG